MSGSLAFAPKLSLKPTLTVPGDSQGGDAQNRSGSGAVSSVRSDPFRLGDVPAPSPAEGTHLLADQSMNLGSAVPDASPAEHPAGSPAEGTSLLDREGKQSGEKEAAVTVPVPNILAAAWGSKATLRASGSMASNFSMEDDEEDVLEKEPWCWACRQHCGKGKGGWCYWLFVLTFLGTLYLFPLFLKWMITVPMPLVHWNQKFPDFPVLKDQRFVQSNKLKEYKVDISPIPSTWSGCNHTCGAAGGFLQTSEMNFQVDMEFEAPGYDHTAYPVLFASNDFEKWWLAADRRHAEPQPFFAGVTKEDVAHRRVTDSCTRVPEDESDVPSTTDRDTGREHVSLETFSSSPTYVLVCVAWDVNKIQKHEDRKDRVAEFDGGQQIEIGRYDLRREDLATMCDAVGGVAGWPCALNPDAADLPGVTDGVININNAAGTVAGEQVNGTAWQGSVSVHACLESPDSPHCVASTLKMSQWPCQQCVDVKKTKCDDTTALGSNRCRETCGQPVVTLNTYESFPKLEVQLKDMPTEDVRRGAVPRAYVMTTPFDQKSGTPWGLTEKGTWRKLYEPEVYYKNPDDPNSAARPPPQPYASYLESLKPKEEEHHSGLRRLAETLFEIAESPVEFGRRLTRGQSIGGGAGGSVEPAREACDPIDLTPYIPTVDRTRNKMEFYQRNRLSLQPSWCFGERGPLYLVACAANESTWSKNFTLQEGQAIAPPPFNDRCLAVAGRCGNACMEQQSPGMEFCGADGTILFDKLIKDEDGDDFIAPSNSGPAVNIFIWMLLFGFAVKIITFFPGLFVPYKAARFYEQQQTEQFKYIAVCCPTNSETKACVLRNLVGSMSSMPSGCHCPFNVVVMDEGHRHPHKVMFRAFADVLDKIPDGKISANKEARSPRANKESFKEKNVRAFTKQWVDLTRSKKLDDCNTEKIAKKIKELKQVDGDEDKVKKLNDKLDELCGKKALQILQEKHGWPKAKDGGDNNRRSEIELLEAAIAQLRNELAAGEKTFDTCHENIKPVHLDDVEAYTWVPKATESNRLPKPLYILHYVARAKPDEDERTLKTQHVARGCWYYKVPMDENRRSQKSWLDWRRGAKEYEDGDFDSNRYIVPVATSRGKAGGLNFVENYLFHYYLKVEERYPLLDENTGEVMMQMKPSLFSIADARHQYQPNFFHETIPFFFLKGRTQVNPWVAFTQSPPYFPEQEDEQDYLDSNNSNFFRLHCMLRNCCGGVSSKGTNGTWLIKDRRTGVKGTSSIWDLNTKQKTRSNFTQLIEHRFFRESCKVEDLATSLDVIVQGKHSQYINRRLSYGMAKDPSHYLAGVQRQTEGGVVLALQTFFRKKEGTPMVWMAFTVFTLFVASLANLMYGQGSLGFVRTLGLEDTVVFLTEQQADLIIRLGLAMETDKEAWKTIILDTQVWVSWVLIFLVLLVASSSLSYVLHHCTCCGKRRHLRRTRFPTSMAQWARLLILLDSMTYYLWFWTAFFWIGFNYSMVFTERTYHFEAKPMTVFSWVLQALSWAMVIFATARYRMDQSMQANEVFFLSLTNLWRTTQLFYITAPLTLYSIATGCGEFSRHRMLGVDISYWSAGDRGSISTTITKWWTLLLMLGMVAVNVIYWFNLLAFTDPISVLIVTFIGLDVVHICSFLWLGTKSDPLPNEPSATLPKWQWCIARACQLIFSINFYRNMLRTVVFNSMFVLLLQWVGPLQHVVFPLLIPFRPELGVNQALLLLIAGK